MNFYESLIDKCYESGISVSEKHFKSKSNGLWKNRKIAINNAIQTEKEKYCTLAEEYAHYKLTVGNILDQNKIENRKQEIKARRMGYEQTAGLDKIAIAIINGAKNRYEIADKLNVTDEYFTKAVEYLKLKYGKTAYCKGIMFYFEPEFGILKNKTLL